MVEKGFDKVMRIWESKNKIANPNKTEQLQKIVDQMASPFSAGLFYYFVFNMHSYKFDLISENVYEVLGIRHEDFSFQKFFNVLHPEDLERLNEKEAISLEFKLTCIPIEDIPLYKTVYLMRLKDANGDYKTILHQSLAINVSNDGKVQQTLCVHTDVSHLNPPIDHKMSFIGINRDSFYSIETGKKFTFEKYNYKKTLSLRELEILGMLSRGMDIQEIADKLFLSIHTVNTHRKNILKKSNSKNTTELIARCIRSGLI